MFSGLANTLLDKIEIYSNNNYYIIKGNWLGLSKFPIVKLLGNEKRLKYIFDTFSLTEVSFHKFFLPDFMDILDALTMSKFTYGLRIKHIEYIKDWFNNNSKLSRNDYEIDYKTIEKNMSFKILEHQIPIFEKYEFFRKHLHYRGMLLDAEPGTGKTFSSLALATGLKVDKVIIICPLQTVEKVWVKSLTDETENVFKEPQDVYRFDKFVNYNKQKYVICHYEALKNLERIIKDYNNLNTCIIIDESHNLNDLKSSRTKLAIDIVDKIRPSNVFLLSGTPLKSGFREMTPMLRFLDPTFNEKIMKKFLEFYKNPNDFVNELLKRKYGLYSVKVTKANIGLPDILNLDLKIKLPGDLNEKFKLSTIKEELRTYIKNRTEEIKNKKEFYYNEYKRLLDKALEEAGSRISDKEIEVYENNFNRIKNMAPGQLMMNADLLNKVNLFEQKLLTYLKGQDKKDFAEFKTIVKYPELKIQGEALGKIVTGARIQCHVEMAKYINYVNIIESTTKKTIIFSNYIKVCDTITNKLHSLKYKPCGVYGDLTKDLTKTVNEFTKNKKLNPLVASYKSLATGVPLTDANIILCLDLPFRMYTYEQAIARVWRLGQDKTVYVYKTVLDTDGEANINSRNIDIIKFFKDEIEKITGYKYSLDLDTSVNIGNEDFMYYKQTDKINLVFSKNSFESFNTWGL